MELIDRYAAEVGRNLPEKSRPDVVKELRSTLEDMLEDRATAAGRAPDEEMVVELLKEYGAPYKVASTYQPPKYLIGPQLYPGFITVVKVVLPIVLIVFLVMFGFAVTQPGNAVKAVAEWFGNTVGGVVYALGMLTLIFAAIERLSPELKIPEVEWDPRSLRPAEGLEDRPKLIELGVNIFFAVLAIIVFSMYGRQIGIIAFSGEDWSVIPVFTEAFFRFIPVFIILWALGIGRDLWVIAQNRWSTGARIFSGILHLVNIGVLLALLSGDPVVYLGAEAQAELTRFFGPINFEQINTWVDLGLKLALGLAVAGTVVELIRLIVHLVRQAVTAVSGTINN